MAFFETTKIKDGDGNLINPAQEESLTLLRAIFRLLKPLGFITGSGSNRINLDVNNVTTIPSLSTNTLGTVTTLSTVTTVTTATNITNLATSTIGPTPTFELLKAMSRTAYNSGIRANIT
jgi:hypothetical protein